MTPLAIPTIPRDAEERLLELLTDRATQGLAEAESAELRRRAAAHDVDLDLDAMTCLAAMCELALMSRDEYVAMPAPVRDRLNDAGLRWARSRGTPGAVARDMARDVARVGPRPRPMTPWLAAAAALALAAVGWYRAIVGSSAGTSAGTGAVQEPRAFAGAPDQTRVAWGDWDAPEIAGVKGDVTWSDAAQAGVMRFVGLPPCKPGERYQLWIIDATRGMDQRVSGGTFDGCAPDKRDVVVPITPALHVRRAAAFAVTIEAQDGTWVSDMKRRVVIAKRT